MAKLPYTRLLGLISAIVLGLGGALAFTGGASADTGIDAGGGISIRIDDDDEDDDGGLDLGGILSDDDEDDDDAPVTKKVIDKAKAILGDADDDGDDLVEEVEEDVEEILDDKEDDDSLLDDVEDVIDDVTDIDDDDDDDSPIDEIVDEVEEILDDEDSLLDDAADVIDDVTDIDDDNENSGEDDNESSSLDDVVDDVTGIADDDDEEDDSLNDLLGDESPLGSELGNDGQPLGGVLDEDESSTLDPILDDVSNVIDADDRSFGDQDTTLGGLLGDDSPVGDLVGDDGELLGGVLDDDDTEDGDDGAGVELPDLNVPDVTDIIDDDPNCQGTNCGPEIVDQEILDDVTGLIGLGGEEGQSGPDNEDSILDEVVEDVTDVIDEDFDAPDLGDLLGDESPLGSELGNDGDLLGGVLDEDEGSALDPILNEAADLLDEDPDSDSEAPTLGNLLGDSSPVGDLLGDNGELLGGVLDDDTDETPDDGGDGSELLDPLTDLVDFEDGDDLLDDLFDDGDGEGDDLLDPLGLIEDDFPVDVCLGVGGIGVTAGAGCDQDTDECTDIDLNCLGDEILEPVIGPSSFVAEIVELCVGVPGLGAQGNTGSGCGDDAGEDDDEAGIDDIIDDILDDVEDVLDDVTDQVDDIVDDVTDDLPVDDVCVGGIGDCDEGEDPGDGDGDDTDDGDGDGTDDGDGDGTGGPDDGTDDGDIGTIGGPDGGDAGSDGNTAIGTPVSFLPGGPLPPAAPIEPARPAAGTPAARQPFSPPTAGDGGLLAAEADATSAARDEAYLALIASLLVLATWAGLTRALKRI